MSEKTIAHYVQYAELISAIAMAFNQPGLHPVIPQYLSLVVSMMGSVGTTIAQINELKAHVMSMVRENREPTDEEWSELEEKVRSTFDKLQDLEFPDEKPVLGSSAYGPAAVVVPPIDMPAEPPVNEPADAVVGLAEAPDPVDDPLDTDEK